MNQPLETDNEDSASSLQLVIYGTGEFGRQIRRYIARDTNNTVAAFCVDMAYMTDSVIDGVPVVAFEDVTNIFPIDEYHFITAVGYKNMRARKLMYEKVRAKGYRLTNYISPHACIDKETRLGDNNIIFQGTQIEPSVKIGSNNIIWASVNVSHDVIIGDHCFIASQSLIGGSSIIEDGCFLGFNATVAQNVHLAEETLLGAKSLAMRSTKKYSRNYGIPARLVSLHEQDGIRIS